MGIYDREYIRVGPRSTSGLGSLRFISFNSWLLIANIAIFVLNIATSGMAVPVVLSEEINPSVQSINRSDLEAERVFRDQIGQVIPERLPVAFRNPQGQLVPDPQGRTARHPNLGVGGSAYRLLYHKPSRTVVGRELVTFMPPLQAWGHFSTALGFMGLEIWRFITFQFLHANFLHLLFNMFGLWVFGGMVEQYLGFKRYAAFYLTCGIFGAVAYLILNLLGAGWGVRFWGVLPGSIYTPLVGASAGVFGVIIACAYIAPNAIVQLIFPPIPMKLKWFAYGYVALATINLLRGGANAGGDAAHLGGAVAGYFFIRNAHLLRDFFDVLGDSRKPSPKPRRPAASEAELDRILAKVKTEGQGLSSLTNAEKRALHRSTVRKRRA
jgi:membrane associated rhomboid family serine protease